MSLQDQIIIDVAKITSNINGFNSTIYLTATTGETATIIAPSNKIGRAINEETGVIVNTKNATIVFSESVLLISNQNYPIRNSFGEVSMIGHLVNVKDSTGVLCFYCVGENIPDENVGLITLKLKDYDPS